MVDVVVVDKKHLFPINQLATIEKTSDVIIFSFMDGTTLIKNTSSFIGLEIDDVKEGEIALIPPLSDGLFFKSLIASKHLINVKGDMLMNAKNITAISVSPIEDDWKVTLTIGGGTVKHRTNKLFPDEFDAEDWVKMLATYYFNELKV